MIPSRQRSKQTRNNLSPTLLLILLLSAVCLQATAREFDSDREEGLFFSPVEWNFGIVLPEKKLRAQVLIENKTGKDVRVEFFTTCDCLFSRPESTTIASRSAETFMLEFNPASYSGEVSHFFIIETDFPGLEKGLFEVFGTVTANSTDSSKDNNNSQSSPASKTRRGNMQKVTFTYYYAPGCARCEEFLENGVPLLGEKLEIDLSAVRKNIYDPDVFEEYAGILSKREISGAGVPAVLLGDILIMGRRAIEDNLENEIKNYISAASIPVDTTNADDEKRPYKNFTENALVMVPVLLAGLLDGVNPCAFTTLIFLLASLAVAGKSRRQVFIIGIFFTLSVFISYSMIGLGLFKVLRASGSFPIIAEIIRWVLLAVLVVFATLSFYDFLLIRKGRAGKILLQLPDRFKQRIHTSVRTGSRSGALISAAISMGFIISIFELACTGQIYFPTIAYMIRVERELTGYYYLLLYNVGFILPLIGVFIITYFGISSKKITSYFQKHMAIVKLATVFLFAGLAVLTYITV
jgi:cytochrome c biogenesis protein CcdA